MKARNHYKTEFVSYIPQEMKEGVVYVCLPYNIAAHLCACGCKSEIYTPISRKSGWVLTYDGVNVSLTPSIGNGAYPCRSHYFLQDGKVRWLPPIMTDTQLGRKAKTKGRRGILRKWEKIYHNFLYSLGLTPSIFLNIREK